MHLLTCMCVLDDEKCEIIQNRKVRYGGRDFGGYGGRGHGNRCVHIVARLATLLKHAIKSMAIHQTSELEE